MNMRWGWTLPVLSALAAVSAAGPARGQGGAAAPTSGAPAAMQAQGYAPAFAAGQPGGMPVMIPQAMAPQGMYMPAMYPPSAAYPVQPVAYAAPAPTGAPPDVYGSYGYIPVDFAAQPHAPPSFGPPGYGGGGYGPSAYGSNPYGQPGYAQQAAFDQGAYGGPGGFGGPGGYGGPMDGQMPGGPMGGMGGGPMGGMGGGPMGGMGGGPMGGMGGGPMGGMDGNCQYCGGQGCPHCGGHGGDGTCLPNGLCGDVLGLIAPYPDGGCAAPRWYDFAVDYMMLKRDNTGFSKDFASLGRGGPIVLKTDDLDFGSYRPGFRFQAALQIAAANSLEFIYFGQFNYTAKARATAGGQNLFSVFSDFGTAPFPGIPEFDQADFAQLNYISSFDSFEINWRCRWMAPNCRYQGSWTAGVRHFILNEKFRYATSSVANGFLGPTSFIPARARVDTDTTNDLTGLQIGSDAWICLFPGLRAGGELQAGVYGNHMGVSTIAGSNLNPNTVFNASTHDNNVSFIGQLNLLATYRINYQWSLRGGYQFLYVNGVALASDNFNTQPPLVTNPFAKNPPLHDNGSVFYHGWNVGLEYMW